MMYHALEGDDTHHLHEVQLAIDEDDGNSLDKLEFAQLGFAQLGVAQLGFAQLGVAARVCSARLGFAEVHPQRAKLLRQLATILGASTQTSGMPDE
eukprot:2096588-Pyramimonas_sp.AAC.1